MHLIPQITADFFTGNVTLFFVFWGSLLFFALPYVLYKVLQHSPTSVVKLPLFGILNLLLLLQLLATFNYFIFPATIPLVTGLFLLLTSQLLVIFLWQVLHQRISKPTLNVVHLTPALVMIAVHLFILIIVSAYHYDPVTHQFFVPGHEINHDSITIATSVKMLLQDKPAPDSLGRSISDWIFVHYPLGGTYLMAFFSRLVHTDIFFLMGRLIILTTSLVIFPLTLLLLKLQSRLTLLHCAICLLTIWNYLTLSMIHAAVTASTLASLFILTGISLFTLRSRRLISHREYIVLFLLNAFAGVFTYTYIIPLYLALFLLVTRLFNPKLSIKLVFLTTLMLLVSLLTPHSLLTGSRILTNQFTSAEREINLFLGMKGGTPDYLHPLQITSLWISRRLYYNTQPRLVNYVLVAVLFVITVPMLTKLKLKKIFIDSSFLLAATLLGTFSLPLLATRFVTQSTYQFAKSAFYLASVWPLVIYFLYRAIYSQPDINLRQLHTLLMLVMVVMLSGGLLAGTSVQKPPMTTIFGLQQLEQRYCLDQNRSDFALLGRNRWSRYFLLNCASTYHYFDDRTNFDQLIKLKDINHISQLSQFCQTNQYLLPTYPANYNTIITDRCFTFNQHNYQLSGSVGDYQIFKRR